MSSDQSPEKEHSRYKLVELIEEGLSGKLYRAKDTREGVSVLLKLVPKALSKEPSFRRYFYDRWAQREATIEHPNVARIVEVGMIGEQYFAVVEDLPGERLSDRVKSAPLDPDEVLDVMRQVAEALRAAHRQNIVHCHLKPTDIFLTQDHRGRPLVKVLFLDLGTGGADGMLSLFGELSGPPKYLAPEVIRGGMPTAQSDLFALGVIAYQMLTGQEPFPAQHAVGYLFANCEGREEPAHEVRQSVPRELSQVVSRCLAKMPPQRYGSAQRVIDDLDRCQETIKTGHVAVVPMGTDSAFARNYKVPAPKAPRTSRAAPLAVVVSLAVALCAVGVTLVVVLGDGRGASADGRGAVVQPRPTQDPTPPEAQPEEGPGPDEKGNAQVVDSARARVARASLESAQIAWRDRYSGDPDTYDLAVTSFLKVAQEYPGLSEARAAAEQAALIYCEWAKADLKGQMFEQAEGHYREAIKVAPTDSQYAVLARRELPKVLAAWADDSRARGFHQEALDVYERVKAEFPESLQASLLDRWKPDIFLHMGYGLWKQEGDLDGAADKFGFVVANYAGTPAASECAKYLPQVHLDIVQRDIKDGRLQEAQQQLSMLRTKYPRSEPAQAAAELEAQILYELIQSSGGEAAEGHFQRLQKEYPASVWAVKAACERLELLPEVGRPMLDLTEARKRLEGAEEMMAEGKFAQASAELRLAVTYTPPESDLKAQALARLPESLYYEALGIMGVGRGQESLAALERFSETFDFTPWAEMARTVVKAAQDAPPGMVYVPEGPFYMGASRAELVQFLRPRQPAAVFSSEEGLDNFLDTWAYSAELPGGVVSANAFYIDKTEVTNEQYKEFVDSTGHPAPAGWADGAYPAGDARKPVVNVSHDDASAYAKWAGKRLPTETEWEKAARGVDGRFYPWGSGWDKKFARHLYEPDAGAVNVGSYPGYASPYGCLDMLGNVMEWTDSRFEPYPGSLKTPDELPFGAQAYVRRGGAWSKQYIRFIPTRCSARYAPRPTERPEDRPMDDQTGFRCAKDAQ